MTAAGATLAVALALIVAPAPATATAPAAVDAPTASAAPPTVALEGLLRVIPVEAPPEHLILESSGAALEVATADSPAHSVDVTLFTDDGTAVELITTGADSAQWAGVVSGSRFEGTVAVPTEIADAVADQAAENNVDLEGAAGAAIVAEVAEAESVALAVVHATIDAPDETGLENDRPDSPTVLAALAPREHTLDVIWLANPGSPAPSSTNVQAALGRLSEFWTSQTNGQISQVRLRTGIQARTVSFNPCDAGAAWSYAAGQFGRAEHSYWNGATASHLVVLTSATACGPAVGLGTYGSSVHSGGLMWATIELDRPAEWDQVIFHEFGHNLGLPHSNARSCSPPTVDTMFLVAEGRLLDENCEDIEYRDRYDVMGGGFWLVGGDGGRILSTLRDVPALSVVHKAQLDALPRESALRRLTIAGGATQTVTILPASAGSGLRGLELIDPMTGERLYVEYRSGTGRDAQSLYALWPNHVVSAQYAPGVRVLRSIPDSCGVFCVVGYSTVLQRHSASGVAVPWMGVDESLTSYDGAVTVRVTGMTPAQATVEVSFTDQLQEFTAAASPTVTGAARWGSTLTASGAELAAWTPRAAFVSYQWLRNGVPISGATKSTLALTSAHVGASIGVRVTARRPGYVDAIAESARVTVTAPTTSRTAGTSRYETAVLLSKKAHTSTVPVVYLATGANYPDALAAAAAASAGNGALLLVPSTGVVPSSVLDRIVELAPSRIVVAGGLPSVSTGVVAQVRQRMPGAAIDRMGGADRYETARLLVKDAFPSGADIVYVSTGANFPDALSAGAAAGSRGGAVMLVEGRAARLDDASRAAIAALKPSRLLIVGDTASVTAGIAADLASIAPVTRLGGASRYATSALINEEAFPTTVAEHFWATGLDYPDALTGAVLAAVRGAPLFVVQPTCVPSAVASHAARTGVSAVTLVGGPDRLNSQVAALRIC